MMGCWTDHERVENKVASPRTSFNMSFAGSGQSASTSLSKAPSESNGLRASGSKPRSNAPTIHQTRHRWGHAALRLTRLAWASALRSSRRARQRGQ
jgi:hypothetical protein